MSLAIEDSSRLIKAHEMKINKNKTGFITTPCKGYPMWSKEMQRTSYPHFICRNVKHQLTVTFITIAGVAVGVLRGDHPTVFSLYL